MVNANNPHAGIDAINLALDRATAAKIRARPELVEIGQANLRRWMQYDDGFVHPVHEEWKAILNFLTPTEIADFVESDTPKANRLRQSTPLTGILSEEERLAILHDYEKIAV